MRAPPHYWTEEEGEIVRREYQGTDRSAETIGLKLGFTLSQVKRHTIALGIMKPRNHKSWTPSEEEKLMELIHIYSPTIIARMMKRSINSVVVHSKRLRLSRRIKDGWFNQREISEIFGLDHHKLGRWLDSGVLKASLHNGCLPGKLGRAQWHIKVEDVRDFILRYAGELTGRNVDIPILVYILTGEDGK